EFAGGRDVGEEALGFGGEGGGVAGGEEGDTVEGAVGGKVGGEDGLAVGEGEVEGGGGAHLGEGGEDQVRGSHDVREAFFREEAGHHDPVGDAQVGGERADPGFSAGAVGSVLAAGAEENAFGAEVAEGAQGDVVAFAAG